MISIITATYNSEKYLPILIDSLCAQVDGDFEWVVVDGGSTDGTLKLLEALGDSMSIRIDSRPDFGIYDALNRGVMLARGDYYLVVGSDDLLDPAAVLEYKKACKISRADLITTQIEVGDKRCRLPCGRHEWLFGMSSYVTSHSVGLLIRKSLHDRFGYYTNKLPIAADHLFVLQALHGGATLCSANFLAGRFSLSGTSGADVLGTPSECMRAQVMAGHNVFVQLFLFFLRVLVRSARKKILSGSQR